MGRGFIGYAIALALVAALLSVHALQLQQNTGVVEARVAMLEHQAITNKAAMVDATFCDAPDHGEWEKVMGKEGVGLECGDIGPEYYKNSGGNCDWNIVKQMPGGRYVAGGEHYGIKAIISVGASTGVHVIRGGTVCGGK